jgi:ABC-type dipeptide/oligopeptide/nickel transport system permease subunit
MSDRVGPEAAIAEGGWMRPRPVDPATLRSRAEIEDAASLDGFDRPPESQLRLAWGRFRRHRVAMASAVVLAALLLVCAAAPWIAPYSYTEQDLSSTFTSPDDRYWLGTDSLGRDQLSRLLYGGRVSLAVGFGVALVSGAFGTLMGTVAGYAGGWFDGVLMRITDFMLALPALIFLIVAARIFGDSIPTVVLIVSSIAWMPLARIVRGVTLSITQQEYIMAAKASGASPARVLRRHVLPNVVGPVVVNLTLTVAAAILLESSLSFLGLGIQPPTPTWGNMLAGSKGYVQTAPWLVWFPGLMILVTVLCVNFVGDGLRDALDPTDTRLR